MKKKNKKSLKVKDFFQTSSNILHCSPSLQNYFYQKLYASPPAPFFVSSALKFPSVESKNL